MSGAISCGSKKDVLARFIDENRLQDLDPRKAEDEFIYQNSIRLNQAFYASLGEQQAFVLSHGRNMMILKIVGYAEKVVEYYQLEDFKAHGWIAHQRYPTKGRVWHPGGAHPFSGMDEALVHNGDFANYHAVSEYLKQHNIYPQFLTDTEVSVQLLDLLNRTFGYPLEYIIEAMAPTTEHDFDRLPPEKQRIYRYIQSAHIHASPDGPWFFIIARNNPYQNYFQLIGITDTSMLRPQVFALQEGEVQIGLICSEKQAIDATLQNLAAEDDRFCPVADKYWNARGGSATDGGAFIFTVTDAGRGDGSKELVCTNKFGTPVRTPEGQAHFRPSLGLRAADNGNEISATVARGLAAADTSDLKDYGATQLPRWDYAALGHFCREWLNRAAKATTPKAKAIEVLTFLNDRRVATGAKKRSSMLQIVRENLTALFTTSPRINANGSSLYRHIDWSTRDALRPPQEPEKILVLNAREFPPEGDACDARLICAAYKMGWRQFHLLRIQGSALYRMRPAERYRRRAHRCLRQLGRLPGFRHRRPGDPCPWQCPGPVGADHETRQTGHLRRCRPDFHVRRQGRGGLCHGQCGRPAADQRRRASPRGHQRHLPGLSGRILHGRRPAQRRGLRRAERHRASIRTAGSSPGNALTRGRTSSPWLRVAPSTCGTRARRSSKGS